MIYTLIREDRMLNSHTRENGIERAQRGEMREDERG
jgi:hypothetical protein